MCQDPLGPRRPAHADVKEGYPCKKWLFIRCCLVYSVKMAAHRHKHAAYHSTDDELFRNVNIDDLEWPWALTLLILSDFVAILAAKKWIATKWMETDEDYLRTGTACRLSRVSWVMSICWDFLFSLTKSIIWKIQEPNKAYAILHNMPTYESLKATSLRICVVAEFFLQVHCRSNFTLSLVERLDLVE